MRAPLGRVALGLGCAAVLALTAPWWGPHYCAALLPAVAAVLDASAAPWDTVRTTLEAGSQPRVAAQFSTAAGFAFHGFQVPPGAWVRTQTLQGYWWQHPVLALGLWAAWPLPTWRRRALALAALAAVLAALAVTDLPLTLRGAMTDLLLAGAAPQHLPGSVPVQVMRVLEGGGRAALTLALAVAVLAACGRVRPDRPPAPGAAPAR